MRMVRAILIDPFTQEVKEVEHDADNYREIYTLLSHETMPVDTFTVVQISDTESIFVDDEGLLKDPTHFFMWEGYPQPLAGKGLVLGVDEEGETVGTKLMVSDVWAKVKMTDRIRLSHFESYEGKTNHPLFGEVNEIGHIPVFVPRDNGQ